MKLAVISGGVLLAVVTLGTIGFFVAGCSLHRPAPQAGTTAAGQHAAAVVSSDRPSAPKPDDPADTRVGGDAEVITEFVDGEFRSGGCRIPTPLPDGYPVPTPPGAIELKRYPLVRRAEIGGTMTPDWGMNFAFFPLFNHIKRRDIAMTSPVELNYAGLEPSTSKGPESWTMSFLYRSVDLAPAGIDPKDARVLIEDIPPVVVVAMGMRGDYKLNRVKKGVSKLRGWLSQQSEWEEAGEPRALFYNGPEVRSRDKWLEVQLPVRRR